MNIVEKMAVEVADLEEEPGWPDPGDALADLEDWKNGGHGKGRSVEISHSNSYGSTAGWEVKLIHDWASHEVTGYQMMSDASAETWPSLGHVIRYALETWPWK